MCLVTDAATACWWACWISSSCDVANRIIVFDCLIIELLFDLTNQCSKICKMTCSISCFVCANELRPTTLKARRKNQSQTKIDILFSFLFYAACAANTLIIMNLNPYIISFYRCLPLQACRSWSSCWVYRSNARLFISNRLANNASSSSS